MNALIKQAFAAGQRAAARDFGVKIADLSPNEAGWLSLLPGSSVVSAATAPEDRRTSRALHHLGGSLAGGLLGSAGGGLAGAGVGGSLGALIAKLTGEDSEEYAGTGASLGSLLGSLGGGGYGAYLGAQRGQEMSQASDPETLRLKRLLAGA